MRAAATDPIATAGTLYLVSTPIGNLGDMTFRAVEVLSSTALIIAEDTRHSRRLLDHYKIATPVRSYHEHNEAKETPKLVERLRSGDSVALISDAGTPLISDPGARLVAAALEAGVCVVPIPGASSVLAALVGSGLSLEKFTFFGFLPRKGSERAETIGEILGSRITVVFFEAGNRVAATLSALAQAGAAERRAVVARPGAELPGHRAVRLRRLLGCADHGDRPGVQERVEIDRAQAERPPRDVELFGAGHAGSGRTATVKYDARVRLRASW